MKLYIINVGVNSEDAQKRGIKSPIFENGTFEFIPIQESKARAMFLKSSYGTLSCFNNKNKFLRDFIEEDYWDNIAHNDPEFTTFTYGDNYIKPKGANFLNVEKGDILLFLARLYNYVKGDFAGNGEQYFIGYITVDDIFKYDRTKEINDDRLKNNVHYIRYKNGMGETFIIFIGDRKKSFRFRRALKVEPEICELIFDGQYVPDHDIFISNENGDVLLNKNGRPKCMKNFHSITRPVQSFLDDKNESQKIAMKKLMRLIKNYI